MAIGYTQGVACCFALAQTWLAEGDPAALRMARAATGDASKDALTWYSEQFEALYMDNSRDGIDTLRHLFALLLGLGPREVVRAILRGARHNGLERAGRHGRGGDVSNELERSFESTPLSPRYSRNFGTIRTASFCSFRMVSNRMPMTLTISARATAPNISSSRNIVRSFHAFVTALGLRSLRQHWGPINREEVELRDAANDMLQQVQALVGAAPEPIPPEPISRSSLSQLIRPVRCGW